MNLLGENPVCMRRRVAVVEKIVKYHFVQRGVDPSSVAFALTNKAVAVQKERILETKENVSFKKKMLSMKVKALIF